MPLASRQCPHGQDARGTRYIDLGSALDLLLAPGGGLWYSPPSSYWGGVLSGSKREQHYEFGFRQMDLVFREPVDSDRPFMPNRDGSKRL